MRVEAERSVPVDRRGALPRPIRTGRELVAGAIAGVALLGNLAAFLLQLQRDLALRLVFENSDAAYISLYSRSLVGDAYGRGWNTPPASSWVPDLLFGSLLHLVGLDGRAFSFGFVALTAGWLFAGVAVVFAAVGLRRSGSAAAAVTGAALLAARYPQFGLTYLFVPGHHGPQASAVLGVLGIGIMAVRRRSLVGTVVSVMLAGLVAWSDPWYALPLAIGALLLGAWAVRRSTAEGPGEPALRPLAWAAVAAAVPLVILVVLRATADEQLSQYQEIPRERVEANVRALAGLSAAGKLDFGAAVLGVVTVLVFAWAILGRRLPVRAAAVAGDGRRAGGARGLVLRVVSFAVDEPSLLALAAGISAVAILAQGLLQDIHARYLPLIPLLVLVLLLVGRRPGSVRRFESVVLVMGLVGLVVAATHLRRDIPAEPGAACVERTLRANDQDAAFGTYWQAKRLRALFDDIDVAQVDDQGLPSSWIDVAENPVRSRALVGDTAAQLDVIATNYRTSVEERVDCGTSVVALLDHSVRR